MCPSEEEGGCMDGDEVGSVLGAQGAQDAGAEPGAQAAQVSSLGAAGAVP